MTLISIDDPNLILYYVNINSLCQRATTVMVVFMKYLQKSSMFNCLVKYNSSVFPRFNYGPNKIFRPHSFLFST